MTAQMIRRFAMTGEFLETAMVQIQSTIRSTLTNLMRDEGFVPLIDVNPVWQTEYVGGEKYTFVYTMQGVFVGKEEAWDIVGVMDGKKIPSTPSNKSEQ